MDKKQTADLIFKQYWIRAGVFMYAYIYGRIMEKEPENLVIEAGNIGYNIHIAPGMLARFPEEGQMTKVYTYTSVREDAFWLYGFTSKEELNLFKLLITVSGIGPKGAMGILSVMEVDTLRLAILSQDAKMIAKAPGVGAKSASRIVLELKDKIKPEDVIGQRVGEEGDSNAVAIVRQEASEALVALGYTVSDAYKVLQQIKITEDTTVEDVIKAALRKM